MRIPTLLRWKWLKRWAALAVCGTVAMVAIDFHVAGRSDGRLFRNASKVPSKPIALVLGTSKFIGRFENRFYKRRMRAAAALYRAGKVRGILVSGDNSRKTYNEPEDMKADLVKLGVPAAYVTLDFAGFRTLDSIVRAKEVFGQRAVVVVSQAFHVQRALYLADAAGVDAVGYVAQRVPGRMGLRVRLREVLARTRAFLDVNLFATRPKFLGPRETVALKPAPQGSAKRTDK